MRFTKEIDHFWNAFTTDGGKEIICGWCKDKFGVSWQVVPYNIGSLVTDPAKGQKVMQEVMKMKKLDMEIMVKCLNLQQII